MRSYSASKVVSRLLSILVLSGMLFGFVDSSWPAIWAQEADEGKIAYIGQDGNVWLVNADGSEARQITFDAEMGESPYWPIVGYSDPHWSPDGTKLYFVRRSGDRGAIVEHELRVEEQRSIGPPEKNIAAIALSPGGDLLAFVHHYDTSPDVCEVMAYSSCLSILDLESVTYSDLSCETCGIFGELSFSPDGTQLAVARSGHEAGDIVVYSLDGSGYTLVEDSYYCGDPEYSPDGDYLWAVCTEYFTGPGGLYVLDLTTGERSILWPFDPPWSLRDKDVSHKGTHLLYGHEGHIIRVPPIR